MSTRLISRPNLAKTIANVLMPTIQDVNTAVAQAVNTLFSQYCRKVDTKGDCVVAPVDPKLLVSKFMESVHENAYIGYENPPDKPNLPRFDFMALLRPPYTWLLYGGLKRNVAMATVGFVVFSSFPVFPVRAINIYRGPTTADLFKTALTYMSIPIDVPKPEPTENPVNMYLMLLSEPVIIPPEGLIAFEAVVHHAISETVDAFIMWIPPIILTSRSAYIAALAPPNPPTT
jgi:hypothetical protein